MNKTLEDPLETDLEEWEILPDNTSFFQFGLHEIQDLISNEIIYADYFIQDPNLIQQTQESHDQAEEESPFKNISISHLFFNHKADAAQQQLTESTISRSETKQSVEKVSIGEKGDLEEGEKEIWEGIGRWRVMGVGALISIGAAAAAAATICVVVLGCGREGKQAPCRRRQQQRNIVRFFSHDEDKGVNRVVEQASRLNQALAAARGTPTMIRTAKISFGGCYDGL